MAHDWEDERERMLRAAGEEDEPKVAAALDRAAVRARAGDLAGAAAALGEVRRWAVERHLFKSWDDGIWVFCGIIRLVRQMSATPVPAAYQRLLDAIPSVRIDQDMTRAQRRFWYGSADHDPHGVIGIGGPAQPAPLSPAAWVGILAAVAAIGYFVFR